MCPELAQKLPAICRQLFTFEGRLGRLPFWKLYLLLFALGAVVWAAGLFAVIAFGAAGGLVFVLFPPVWISLVSITLRRAHDRNHGIAWWALVQVGPLAVGAIAQAMLETQSVGLAWLGAFLSLGAVGLVLWGWVELGFRKGDVAPNRFGAASAA